jgi:hypothetical protein
MIEGILGTIIGTVLGFLLSEWSTKRREDRSEKRQAQSTRAILSLEIDSNLNLLRTFWARVNQLENFGQEPEERKRKLAQNFIELPLPAWNREVLESQIPFLPAAAREEEIVRVFQFYDHLRRLEAIRNDLILAMEVQRDELRAATKGSVGHGIGRVFAYLPPRPFDEKSPACWDECESLVAQLLAKGNPLKPD